MMSTKRKLLIAALCAFMAVATIGSATGNRETGAGGESGGEGGGEESGATLTLDQTFDTVRNGARLILRYDKAASAFVGTVENTTGAMLQLVRVEVHLSNGTELGPTTPQDLAAGRMMDVRLDASGESFTGWTPHAEVGPQSPSGGEGSEGSGSEGGGEHGAGGESGSEGGGEESGATLTLDQTFDTVRNGARLILRYDKAASAFVGTVENTTDAMLQLVRVEVHLSNGTELGPTTPQDLAAGRMMDVRLDASGESFIGWTPHAEVGPQSASGGEGGEGSGGEGGGEHGAGGESGGS